LGGANVGTFERSNVRTFQLISALDNGRVFRYITNMTEHTVIPDYELEETLRLTEPEQFKALLGGARPKILGLLGQRAMSISQIGEARSMPKGTVGHHIKVLESARLIHIVRTRQVRALTEKYYGLAARVFKVSEDCVPGAIPVQIPREVLVSPLRRAISEYAPAADGSDPSTFLISHARIPASRAHEFALRLEALAADFREKATPGEEVYGLVAGVYRTDWPDLPGTDGEESG